MYFSRSSMRRQELEDGIIRYIYTGEQIQIVEYHFPAGRSFPAHLHRDCEQMGLLVKGRMGFEIGGEERIIGAGEYYHAPLGVEHRAWTLDEESLLVDIFAPPRKDLLEG